MPNGQKTKTANRDTSAIGIEGCIKIANKGVKRVEKAGFDSNWCKTGLSQPDWLKPAQDRAKVWPDGGLGAGWSAVIQKCRVEKTQGMA